MMFTGVCAAVAASAPSGPAKAPAATTAASAGTVPGDDQDFSTSAQITQFLDQTINWSRQRASQQRLATEASDLIQLSDTRQSANEIVRLAFDFARAAVTLISREGEPVATDGRVNSLARLQDRLDRQIEGTKQEMEGDRRKLAVATGRKLLALQSTISELEAELALANARRDAVHSMLVFNTSTSNGTAGGVGLRAQIETLAGSVGATASSAAVTGASAAVTGAPATLAGTAAATAESTNIWGLTASAFQLSSKMQRIDAQILQTQALQDAAKALRAPFVAQLKAMLGQGDELAAQADVAGISQLAQERSQLDALTAQFKQITTVVLPLGKQAVLLNLYQKSLANWRATTRVEYHSQLRRLGVHVGVLVLVIVLALVLAALWRRAVYRYVHEPRRRYQFLMLRRFVLWFVIAVALGLAFASRLGSFVTFAGLLTAGVAVALQNVILSVVGYFFLIGKYGIRVGDQVQVGTVAGEVIDIGLVRFHLMEFRGSGHAGPTGRVVAFSNSIVFQSASGGLFKQIPGIDFSWHELTLTLAAGVDFTPVRERLLHAVQEVLVPYKGEIERQSREIQRNAISLTGDSLQPRVRLRYMPAGIEATIRYPVDVRHANEIDDLVAQQLLKTLDSAPKIALAVAGLPDMKLRTDLE